jgi:urease accessory protein
MPELSEIVDDPSAVPSDTLTLPFELRQKSRLLAKLDSGASIALLLPRGRMLRGGDRVRGPSGVVIEVRAAEEPCSIARSSDAVLLARAAYHLGNRHLPLQVGAGFVRYLKDHVLDEMVRAIGLTVVHEDAPFEPEGGAYGGGVHAHGGRAHSHGVGARIHHNDPDDEGA